ncbi:MAG TPA: UDP-N-acetylmuramate--L-alanine ligase [Methylomirabilota bacterium]|jgi:UDP-N-acetylmuramate--alanine ligase|nr:UDP-N-acetylmuramate--L-alanine ligase [Methylomirabilota bacterium]
MNIQQAKNIYCLGIGGIGVSGIARLLFAMGKNVSGSDLHASQITQKLSDQGILVKIGHTVENLNPKPDLVIFSQDVSPDSAGFIELQEIEKLKIPKLTQAQALGELMQGHFGIAVTGTNGKSTTTAILGLILEHAGLDPSVLVGSMLSSKNESEKFRSNARLGSGKFFVAESDEYHRKMLENHPQMIVITNIAEDHLDYYKDLADIKQAFLEYILSMPPDGILIYNADDHNTVEVCRQAKCHKLTFGIHHYADLQAINIKEENSKQIFDLHYDDQKIGSLKLNIPGAFNVSNALAASLAALKLKIDFSVIKESLENYYGLWRRFEVVGQISGKMVISDYAHHPAAITGTIEAAKQFFPGKKILVVFQPHHRNRTQALFKDFVLALLNADEVIIPEIFDVAGREHGEKISSEDLVRELNRKKELATFGGDLENTEKIINTKLPDYDVLLMMGAGDIDVLARKIIK